MTMDREADIKAFLATTGWADAASANLAGDASNRRYHRLSSGCARMVLMDAPPDRGEDIRPFIAVTEWLREQGFSAPALHGNDTGKGFLLLEDLGDDLFAHYLERAPEDEDGLYAAAVDLLVEIAQSPPPAFLQPYDEAVLDRDAADELLEAHRDLVGRVARPEREVAVLRVDELAEVDAGAAGLFGIFANSHMS